MPETGAHTLSRDRICLSGAHCDGSHFGKISPCPPHLHLHEAITLVHEVVSVAKVEDGSWAKQKRKEAKR